MLAKKERTGREEEGLYHVGFASTPGEFLEDLSRSKVYIYISPPFLSPTFLKAVLEQHS